MLCLFQYQSFQFYSVLWNNGETISTRFRRRTSHSKIATNDESSCKGAVEHIILDFSKPGEEKLWKSKSLEYNCRERGRIGETRCRQRPKDSFRLLLSWAMYGKFLFSKLLKVGWWPCLVFSRVENWYWDVRTIGESRCNFLGSDTRIPTWFLSRGNSAWWNRAGNVHDCNNGTTSIHGKKLSEQLSIHRKYNRSHTQTNVRHIYKIGVWARWDLWIGNNWLGESFMEIPVIDRSSFRILCCALVRSSKTPNRTMHGNKDWDG